MSRNIDFDNGGFSVTSGTHDKMPLAIIGFAARYSQEASNAERFWDFLLRARQSTTPFPKDRINADAYYHPDPEHGGTFHTKGASFLEENPVAFDAAFFNVSKTEVMSLDPQQRLVMENVYHALENAGIPLNKAVSSKTSVFASGFNSDHVYGLNSDLETTLKHKPTGSENSMISGRVSWFYDFSGASLTVDTACSSSMVALHLACQNLRSGDSEMAVVSGMNVVSFIPDIIGMSHSGFLGSEGMAFPFDHRANGYARGEGVGTLVVRPLNAALEDGNTIRAIIRGTAVNQDGRTPGLTYPSAERQQQLIRTAYENAALDPLDTMFIEAHGAGTQAGDPIEAASIAHVFRTQDRETPMYIGAVKANIGHLEGGSGVAGIIKGIYILEKGIIPPNVNFEKVNPQIPMDAFNISFPTECLPWPSAGTRRVSVSSFGLSGTNGHCILEDAYHYLKERKLMGSHNTRVTVPCKEEIRALVEATHKRYHIQSHMPLGKDLSNGNHDEIDTLKNSINITNGHWPSRISVPKLFIFSVFDEDGMNRTADELVSYLKDNREQGKTSDDMLSDLAYTAAVKRSRFRWNSYILADSLHDLENKLSSGTLLNRVINVHRPPTIGFVFTGQGAQYCQMGKQLVGYPVFRQSLEDATKYMTTLGSPWSLLDEILKEKSDSRVDQPLLSHAACTAIQVALVDLLASWSITPSRVVGHSSGEIAAAYGAGKISRESAWNAAYWRSHCTAMVLEESVEGSMLAVGLNEMDLQSYLEKVRSDYSGVLTIACFNSPKNNTVSGHEIMINALKDLLDVDGIFARKLKTSRAYHSSHMNRVGQIYSKMTSPVLFGKYVSYSSSRHVRMFSTVTGEEINSPIDHTYWSQNMVSTVKFTTALRLMCLETDYLKSKSTGDHPADTIIEIGPHGALQSAIKETLATGPKILYLHTLSRHDCTPNTFLDGVGKLAIKGAPVDINAVNQGTESGSGRQPRFLTSFPSYAFNHNTKDIFESRLTRNARFREHQRHDLFGAPVQDWNPQSPKWRHFLRVAENPWLKHHMIADDCVFPGAGYIVMAVEASRQIADKNRHILGFHLKNVLLKQMLVIPDTLDGIETSLSLSTVDKSSISTSSMWKTFHILSYSAEHREWVEHCTGYISIEYAKTVDVVDNGREEILERQKWDTELQDGLAACQTPFNFSRLCDHVQSLGIQFGPLFRRLSDLMISGEQCGTTTGVVTVPDIESVMPQGYAHPHLIHPTTLDSTFQAGLAAICDLVGNTLPKRASIPTSIKNAWLSADFASETQFRLFGQAVSTATDNVFNFDARVWGANDAKPKWSVEGVRLAPFQSGTTSNTPQFHLLEWRPDANLLENDGLKELFPARAVPGLYEFEKHRFSQLQLAGALLAADALRELKIDVEYASLEGHFQRFYELLKKIIADARDNSIPYLTLDDFQRYMGDEELKQQLYCTVEANDTNGAFLVRMGTQLASFFRKEADPLYIMFGQDDLMTRYYDEDMEMGPIPDTFAYYMSILRHDRTGLRVLEIGAGTGGFTKHVLEKLCPRNTEPTKNTTTERANTIATFVFTDISPSFFEKAKERLHLWEDILEFKKLDCGGDPSIQDFEPGTYDLIVASNVLHATPNLHQTLSNVRRLLKPAGKLLFLEGVRQDTLWTNLSFGSLPGWWLGTEEFRRWCPNVSIQHWNTILQDTGFSGVDINIPSSQYPEFTKHSIVVSTAVERSTTHSEMQNYLIYTPGVGESTATSLLHKVIEKTLQGSKCTIVDHASILTQDLSNTVCISLIELESPALAKMDEHMFLKIRKFLCTCKKLLWITGDCDKNPEYSLATGLIRTLRCERASSDVNFNTLAIDLSTCSLETVIESTIKIIQRQFSYQQEGSSFANSEYRLYHNVVYTNRIGENPEATRAIYSRVFTTLPVKIPWATIERPMRTRMSHSGALDRVEWVSDSEYNKPLRNTEVEIHVHAVGLNFRDLLSAMGELPQSIIGGEGAGVVTRVGPEVQHVKPGSRVGYLGDPAYGGTLRTYCRTNEALVIAIPDELSFETAAGLPATYGTAIYALKEVGRLISGEKVLIHAAAGGVGQAAIQYAHLLGAEVFATVSSVKKKDFLMKHYNVAEDHIFSSRDQSFAKGVRRMCPNGVDIVLNSLSGEFLHQSWECVAPFGRFIEIGKRDILAGTKLDMTPLSKNATIASVDLLLVAQLRPSIIQRLLQETKRLWNEGSIQAAKPTTILSYGKLEDGFRLLQTGRNIGKIILVPGLDPVPVALEPLTPYQFDENASYILIGGLIRLGCSIADWMATRRAKHLIFFSRFEQNTVSFVEDMVVALGRRGCQAYIFDCDITNREQLSSVLSQCIITLPPIKGCIQWSKMRRDGGFQSMEYASWQTAIEPNVYGSFYLHEILPKNISFFVMLSSVAGIMGNRDRANYNAGNTFQDALARYRVARGLHAASVDLGAVMSEQTKDCHLQNHHREDEMLAILEYVIDQRTPLTETTCQLVGGLSTAVMYRKQGIPPPKHLDHPLFTHLQGPVSFSSKLQSSNIPTYQIKALLSAAGTQEQAVEVALKGIQNKLSILLNVPENHMDNDRSVRANGVDSLIEMEFRSWLAKELGFNVSVADLTLKSITELSQKVTELNKFS